MTREYIGVRNLMWGSDYPHHDSIFPRSQEVLNEIFAGVPDEDRYRITAAAKGPLEDAPSPPSKVSKSPSPSMCATAPTSVAVPNDIEAA
jgi:hypothetical protein